LGKAWLGLWIGWAFCLCVAAQPDAKQSEKATLPELTEIQQILQLPQAEAEHAYPVRLQGVVTCCDHRAGLWFLQDNSGGIYLYVQTPRPDIKWGQRVNVKGFTGGGRLTPIVIPSDVVVQGEAPMPAPHRITIDRLSSGKEDSQWIEIQGVVRSESENWGHWVLDLVSNGRRLPVRIINMPTNQTRSLIDTKVRVQGVAAALFGANNQLSGFQILSPSLDFIQVEEPGLGDPFVAPLRLGRPGAVTLSPRSDHRVRVRGVVTLQIPGEALYLNDASGGFKVLSRQKLTVHPGDIVEAVGFPATDSLAPILEEVVYKKMGSAQAVQPLVLLPHQAWLADLNNQLVQIDAELMEKSGAFEGRLELVFQSGSRVFRAHWLQSDPESVFRLLPNGSRVRITGILTADTGSNQTPISWHLYLRSPADIEVLSRPASWLLLRAAWILGGLCTLTIGGMIWIATIRRKVQQATASLRAAETALESRYHDLFENANDMVFTLSPHGLLTSLNRAGELIIGLPREKAMRMHINQLLTPASRELFQQIMARHQAGETRCNFELEIAAINSRQVFLEVNTRLALENGQKSGLSGIARDITERKQAESDLRNREQQLRQALMERRRISRDLHDDIIQSIYGVGLGLEDSLHLVKENPDKAYERLQYLREALNRVIGEVRAFIVGLEPEMITGAKFHQALQSLTRVMGDAHAAKFILSVDPSAVESLDVFEASSLLQIAREAISNSLRHADASATHITLQRQSQMICLQIQDNGLGFEINSVEAPGHGLRNIRDRANEIGARLSFTSSKGQGTLIRIEVPKP
jgi:PAS domain S-box-containing protein